MVETRLVVVSEITVMEIPAALVVRQTALEAVAEMTIKVLVVEDVKAEVSVVVTQADSTAATVVVSEVITVVALAAMTVETEDQTTRCTYQAGHKTQLKKTSKVVLKTFVVASNKFDCRLSARIAQNCAVLDLSSSRLKKT